MAKVLTSRLELLRILASPLTKRGQRVTKTVWIKPVQADTLEQLLKDFLDGIGACPMCAPIRPPQIAVLCPA
jgi:hypothetical protein